MENKKLANRILSFYKSLKPDFSLPRGVEVMNPFEEEDAAKIAGRFYQKYYDDINPRVILFGINPGRFGAGVTGVPFTDPIRLEQVCGIENHFDKKPELSSEFVYEVVDAYGGPALFYDHFFVSAVCPLGFTKDGKNLNYYDDKQLLKDTEPFIVETIREQIKMVDSPDVSFCLGKGTNFKYFVKLNEKHHFFKRIEPLPHPRWVMQYRRKRKNEFVKRYVDRLERVVSSRL
ncbi:MAG TPA: uracil-DNA glycosylase family protein [Balneolales bacterium]|nr:uracil-DNA glycosylase family protein [Balneolales bacterium]